LFDFFSAQSQMPEARDRIERPVDYPAAFLNRRSHGILLDEPATQHNLFGSPVQRVPSEATGGLGSIGQGSMTGRGGLVRGNFGIRRTGGGRRGQIQFRSPQGRENMSLGVTRRGRARASNSVLPSWYPRTPLRDISAVVRVSSLNLVSFWICLLILRFNWSFFH